MAAYERVTLNRGGRNSRFDCTTIICLFFSCRILTCQSYQRRIDGGKYEP